MWLVEIDEAFAAETCPKSVTPENWLESDLSKAWTSQNHLLVVAVHDDGGTRQRAGWFRRPLSCISGRTFSCELLIED
jgi:hypothetical protein